MKPTFDQLDQWGASLREIDPESLVPDEDGAQVQWLLGDNGSEVFIWSHPGRAPHHLQLVFARISVEWSLADGLVTGTFKSASSTAGGRHDPYLLSVGSQIDEEVCGLALRLLRRSTVATEALAPLIRALEQALATPAAQP